MPQVIDLGNVKAERTPKSISCALRVSSITRNDNPTSINQFTEILLNRYPNKMMFTMHEAAKIIGIGPEFIRRRIKVGEIKAVSIGDKQMINIIEISRILSEGVK